jgi:hypothetical protein
VSWEGIDGVDGVHCIGLDFHLVIGWVLWMTTAFFVFHMVPREKEVRFTREGEEGGKSFQAASRLCLIHLFVVISYSLLSLFSLISASLASVNQPQRRRSYMSVND